MIGYYLVKFLKLDQIKVSHDLRLSFKQLSKFFIQGVLDANCRVIYQGKSSTPAFYYSLFKGCKSGVILTASHNAKEYNGIKIMYNFESFDSRNGLLDLEKLVKEDNDNRGIYFNQIRDDITNISLDVFLEENDIKLDSVLEQYANYLKDFYDIKLTSNEKEALEKITFSLDFSSGVASLGVMPFLEKTKLNYTPLNQKPDGNFPVHSPDPLKAKEFLESLESNNSIFTGAFDGDGDRLVFFDEKKKFILQDYTIAAYIDYFISEGNKSFVCDLRASKVLQDITKEAGANLKLLRVGRSFYMDYLNKHSSVFGAELSGHLFFRDFNNLDNPDIALIYMLKIVAQQLIKNPEFKFSELVHKYQTYIRIPETNLKVRDADDVLEALKVKYKKNLSAQIDGYSFDVKDYWFNVRKSNTEPIIRINFEGNDQKITNDEFKKLIDFIKSV
jgi:phosphomannomutase